MQMLYYKSMSTAWIIVKLVVPFSLLADFLQYFGFINNLSFIFEPFTNSLNLPAGVALSFASVIFFNLYAGIAVASTLGLNAYEWTIVGTFMAICHSIPLESAVLKKVGMNIYIHWISRFVLGYLGAFLAIHVISSDLQLLQNKIIVHEEIKEFFPYMMNSIYSASILAIKVIFLVVSLILFFEYLKRLEWFKVFLEKYSYMSSLSIGGLLGVTYGAGILLQEMKQVKKEEKILLLVFLMLAHGLIEETLIFAFFGADIWSILLIRVSIALIAVLVVFLLLKKFNTKEDSCQKYL